MPHIRNSFPSFSNILQLLLARFKDQLWRSPWIRRQDNEQAEVNTSKIVNENDIIHRQEGRNFCY